MPIPARKPSTGPAVAVLAVLLLALVVCLGCGGGGDKTPPTITAVTVTPNILDYQGGQATVSVTASDDVTAAPALLVTAELLDSSQAVVAGPATLTLAGATYSGVLTAPSNLTAQQHTYTVRVSARDAAGNTATDQSQSLTVSGLDGPPPPPPP